MIEALATIASLLHKYSPRQAEAVEALVRAARAGDPNADRYVCADALWGADGLWDTGPQVLQRPHHDAAACRADELAYRGAFLALADHIARHELGTEHERRVVREVADTFRAWEREGL